MIWACLFGALKTMGNKKVIITSLAPQAIGTYSQGISTGNLVFTSGQIPVISDSGELLQGSFGDKVKQALINVDAVLKAGGSSLDNAVKLTVYLTDIKKISEVNAAFSNYFQKEPPARSAVEVSALPLNAEVEIEAVGVIQ